MSVSPLHQYANHAPVSGADGFNNGSAALAPGSAVAYGSSPTSSQHYSRSGTPSNANGLSPSNMQPSFTLSSPSLSPGGVGGTLAGDRQHGLSAVGNNISRPPSRQYTPIPGHSNMYGPTLGGEAIHRPLSRTNSHNSATAGPRAVGNSPYASLDMMHHRPPGDTRTQLFVGNLPFRVRWQDLKDLFRKCGAVLRSDVALTLDNRSKGFGTVLFANESDAVRAIDTYNGFTWQSRVLDVRLDQQDPTGAIAMANAAAQAAQQAAQQNHQQAMHNMASMMSAAGHHPSGHMMNHFGSSPHLHPHTMAAAAAAAQHSPWMAAAVANANLVAAQAQANAAAAALQAAGANQYIQQVSPMPPLPNAANPLGTARRPSASPAPGYASQQSLASAMESLAVRRDSSFEQRPTFPPSTSTQSVSSSSNLASPAAPPTSGASPLMSPVSSHHAAGEASLSSAPSDIDAPALSKTSGPQIGAASDSTGQTPPPISISPTAARRAPPGSLGPMPPSIFANMSSTSQLPNPPAAAAAAVAAGYSIQNEAHGSVSPTQSAIAASGNSSGSAISENGPVNNGNGGASPAGVASGMESRRSSTAQYPSDNAFRGVQNQSSQTYPNIAAPMPLPGGLVPFYAHSSASGGNGLPHHNHQAQGPSPQMLYRNTPSPGPAGGYANRHLFVGNIPFNCQWQDLKDLFRGAGQILRADVSQGPDGRSRGFGTVLFATPDDAINAVHLFNGFEYQGRTLKVHFDKFAPNAPGSSGMSHGQYPGNAHPYAYSMAPMHGIQSPAHLPRNLNHPPHDQQQQRYGQGAPPPYNHPLYGQVPHQHDDNSSVPGTPIYEATLHHMAGFPSPGFGSPVPQQVARQTGDQRRAGMNVEGVTVAAIGSEHHAAHNGLHDVPSPHQSHHPPLSPLTIPPRSIGYQNGFAIPSPGGGMFSPPLHGGGPMSPHHGMPLMTPSMPGFSFHPFPQTPPLLPQFLSPGLGPFSPPLQGGTSFFAAGPSSLRNVAPGAAAQFDSTESDDHTPLQSPKVADGAAQNYFPGVDSVETVETADADATLESDAVAEASSDEQSQVEPLIGAGTPTIVTPEESAAPSPEDTPALAPRRSSFIDITKTSDSLGPAAAPATSVRGVSMDIPRPNLAELRRDSTKETRNASALEDNGLLVVEPRKVEDGQQQSQKKSPWNLSWLKK